MTIKTMWALALGCVTVGGAAAAQTTNAVPAEFPPASYTANQYVDSAGCAFIRAGISGAVSWVPRMNRQREQLCGFQPSLASAPTASALQPVSDDLVLDIPGPNDAPTEVAAATGGDVAAEAVVATSTVAVPTSPVVTQVPTSPVVTQVQTPAVVAAPVEPVVAPTAEPRRVTLAEICAEIAATGRTFINQATGQPVDCAGASQQTAGLGLNLGLGQLLGTSVPASNPVGATVQDVERPAGYETAFDDGRVNPNRGLPATTEVTTTTTTSVSTMSAGAVSAGHRYVQVGSFGDAANADRTAARLRALGLPVGFATVTRNGQTLRIVAAGPFGSTAEVQRALQAARSLGFTDAFARR